MAQDPDSESRDHRNAGVAMLGTVLFCAATGMGIGVFFREPVIGGLVGIAVGIVLGIWFVPALMREFQR
jgi:hypothetical protein